MLRAPVRRWAHDHPFLLAVLVLLAVVIPGFARIEQAVSTAQRSAAAAAQATDEVHAQVDRNSALIDCLSTWVANLTDSLQDRDVVNKTARAAEQETWDTFRRLIDADQAPPHARQTMVDAIARYHRILERLEQTESINPYPEIDTCLSDASMSVATFELMSGLSDASCLGRPVTIHGTDKGDLLSGTDRRDVIRTFSGNDIVFAGAGRDLICGGRGGDTLNGGPGSDGARGGRGWDFCVEVERRRSC